MGIRFSALETDLVRRLQAGGGDANGQSPERRIADSDGLPCRHCLQLIEPGQEFLTLAHRPFPAPQPYAELGPIFLHAQVCDRGGGTDQLPAFLASPRYILRGYGADDRIVYGTGTIASTPEIAEAAEHIFADAAVRYIHVRSASNNCYHCRIDRV